MTTRFARNCKADCNWTTVLVPILLVTALALSLYLIISGAVNMHNVSLWSATVLSVINCSSNCTNVCTQHFVIDVSWTAVNTTFQQNNVTGGWRNQDEAFCSNLNVGSSLQVITYRDTPQTLLAVVSLRYEYSSGGFYTGIILFSVVVMSLCSGLAYAACDWWRKRNYSAMA